MARLAIGLIGAGIGRLFGPFGGGVGWILGSFIGNLLFPPDPIKIQGPRLLDLKVQTSTFGIMIPVAYGTIRVSGNMIWATDLVEVKRKTTQGGGGLFKGGGGQSTETTTFSYFGNFAISFVEGPIVLYLRIWADGKLIYDQRVGQNAVKKYQSDIRFYFGTGSELPDPLIEANEGLDIPAHRGLAYMVFELLPLADFGNRLPNITAEVVTVKNDLPVTLERIPVTSTLAQGMFLDPNRPYLYVKKSGVNGGIWKVDAITNNIIAESADIIFAPSNGLAVDVDNEGFLYIPQFSSIVANTRVARVDPNTMTVIATSDEVHNGTLGITVDRESGTNLVWNLEDGIGADKIYCFARSSLSLLFTLDMDDLGHSGAPSSLAVDGEGNAWMPISGSPVNLLKVTPDGFPTFFDVSAIFGDLVGSNLMYDRESNSLIILLGNLLVKWSLDTFSELDRLTPIAIAGAVAFKRGIIDGRFWAHATLTKFREYDIRAMTFLREVDVNGITDADTNYNDMIFYPPTQSFFADHGTNPFGVHHFYIDRAEPGTILLKDIVEDQSSRSGMIASDYDASELLDVVRGYVTTRAARIRSNLEPLALSFFFDGLESDGKIKYPKRGRASTSTIPEADLAAHEAGQTLPALIKTTRGQEDELPRRINVVFLDIDSDYEQGSQWAGRLITEAVNESSVEVPVVFNNSEARQVAEILLLEAWVTRDSQEFRTSYKYIKVDPTDVITISLD